jgi:hypothetical protein
MIKVSPLRYGMILKKTFTKPHIFTAFVKDFFGVEIEIDLRVYTLVILTSGGQLPLS